MKLEKKSDFNEVIHSFTLQLILSRYAHRNTHTHEASVYSTLHLGIAMRARHQCNDKLLLFCRWLTDWRTDSSAHSSYVSRETECKWTDNVRKEWIADKEVPPNELCHILSVISFAFPVFMRCFVNVSMPVSESHKCDASRHARSEKVRRAKVKFINFTKNSCKALQPFLTKYANNWNQ